MNGKAVCFDMDGVLVNTMDDHALAWHHAFREQGHVIEAAEFYELEGMPGMQTILHVDRIHELRLPLVQQEAIYRNKRAHFVEHSNYGFYKHTIKALKSLSQSGIPVGLATGSRKEFVNEVLEKLEEMGITFDAVITGDDVEKGKPSPEPYEKVFAQFPFRPNEWIVVENAPLGIQSAKASGAFVLALLTTLPEEKMLLADGILKHHEELDEYLMGSVRGQARNFTK
ncbi:HAD family hydrolase [Fictibacillus fluitans]|uniref:HAD family phosphatase n=1 Tax=Fictibacillus fluitans TaxID=3058422 RepID=A0ABT8HXD2_9BACL|nr:HAD family phosphatase [Fictibacillus sp. NE201]MDN4525411.1 HAD family phosphatase [Fictibacillus sp. NE201]